MTLVKGWGVVVLRRMPCTELGKIVFSDEVVTVFGPFSRATADERVERFNRVHTEADDGAPVYRPVNNAPAFLKAEEWDEHYAIICPMNDVMW